MTRRRSIFSCFFFVSCLGVLAGCGGSSPNDAFLPPPVITEADAGGEQPAGPPQAVIRIASTGVPTTDEAGGRTTFSVTLSARPASEVVVPITSPTEIEIKVEPSALTFGPNDWDQAKTVTLIGQDEDVDDGDQKVLIGVGPATSSDAAWNGVRTDGIEALNKDDDVAGLEVSTPTPSSTTTEAGTKVTFTVRLKSRPAAPVTIGVTSSVPTEGAVDKAQLVFDPSSWSTAQTVTVTGQDDAVADQDKPFDVDLSKPITTDPAYAALTATKLAFLNLDDDIPGFFVFPPALADRFTTEAGGTRSFTIRLRSKPSADVTVPLSSSKPTEGSLEGVTQIVFTPATYDQLKTVTVKGVDDKVDDGDQPYTVVLGAATSADASYQGKDPPDVDMTNKDDDTAAILVSAPSAALTSETGTSVTFEVKLGSEPTAPVTLSLVSSKPTEGVPDKTELVFDAGNWWQGQTVTVTGQDDKVDDGDQAYVIQIAHKAGSVTTDAKYAAINPPDVNLTNSDDDTQGVTIAGPNGGTFTTEGGASVTFDVVLRTRPTGDVTIPISISNGEATVDKASLVFTAADWDQIQTITVTGKDDFVDDGDQKFDVVFGTATGGGYNFDPPDVTLENIDDDEAEIRQSVLTGALTEAGGEVKFKVRLGSRPAGMNVVTVPITISQGNATASPTSLTFTTATWNVEQEVTVTGKGDGMLMSTPPTVTIGIGPASGDPQYDTLTAPGFTALANASSCGIGGINAGEDEQCDDGNANACDGCETCQHRKMLVIPQGTSAIAPTAALAPAGGPMCIEMWAKSSITSGGAIYASTFAADLTSSFLLRCHDGSKLELITQSDPVTFLIAEAAVSCGDGSWHHVAGCRDTDAVGGTAVLSVFFDGTKVGETVGLLSDIGGNGDLYFDGLNGGIDEIRVSKALRYTADFTPSRRLADDADTQALWHLDEGTGAPKSLPAGNDITLMAGATWADAEAYSSSCP